VIFGGGNTNLTQNMRKTAVETAYISAIALEMQMPLW
jgi:hypothetical protein